MAINFPYSYERSLMRGHIPDTTRIRAVNLRFKELLALSADGPHQDYPVPEVHRISAKSHRLHVPRSGTLAFT